MPSLTTRGFVTFSDVKTDKLGAGNSDSVSTKLGGRVDYHHTIRDFDLTVSGTDASARDWENVPKWNDFVVTADSRFRGAPQRIPPDGWLPAGYRLRARRLGGSLRVASGQRLRSPSAQKHVLGGVRVSRLASLLAHMTVREGACLPLGATVVILC